MIIECLGTASYADSGNGGSFHAEHPKVEIKLRPMARGSHELKFNIGGVYHPSRYCAIPGRSDLTQEGLLHSLRTRWRMRGGVHVSGAALLAISV